MTGLRPSSAWLFRGLFLWLLLVVGHQQARGQASASKPAGQMLAVVGATVYASPTAPALPDAVVLVRDSVIYRVGPRGRVKVPAGARIVDARGLTLTAGFWNCHVHFMEPQWLRADSLPAEQLTRQLQQMLTCYGFTRAFDLAALESGFQSLLRLRQRIARGEVLGPTIYCVGVPMTPVSPFYVAPLRLPEVHTPAQVATHVAQQAARGANGIKIWSASPTGQTIVPMDVELIRAAVAAAHARGLPVFAHPTNNAGVAAAAAGGVDVVVHVSPEDRQNWSPELIGQLLANRVALIPTLKLYQWDLERTGHQAATHSLLLTAVEQLRTYAAAGGQIVFGTDVGFMSDYSPTEEYALMGQAGLSFRQILAALTTNPAQRFRPAEAVGRVAPGQRADLVLLAADPATDVRNLSNVAYTIRNGRIIYQAGKYGLVKGHSAPR